MGNRAMRRHAVYLAKRVARRLKLNSQVCYKTRKSVSR